MEKLIIGLYVLTTSLGLIVLKLGTNVGLPITYINNKLALNINFQTVLGIALYGISFMLYVYLISKYDLGYIIPLATALVYIVIFFASFVIFKEPFTAAKITGIILITSGMIFLNLGK